MTGPVETASALAVTIAVAVLFYIVPLPRPKPEEPKEPPKVEATVKVERTDAQRIKAAEIDIKAARRDIAEIRELIKLQQATKPYEGDKK